MMTVIILVGVLLLAIIVLSVRHYKKQEIKKENDGNPIGKSLLSASYNVPVYGSVIKAVATVGKPTNKILNKVNTTISQTLHHVPVVGSYLAMPNEIAGAAVYKLNDFFGLN